MKQDSRSSGAEVRVARIGKPHGIRGEVTVEIFTDSPERRFSEGSVLSLQSPLETQIFERLTVERARWNKKILLLKFAEVSDRSTAEVLRNVELYAYAEEDPNDTEGWYSDELIGLSVHEGWLGAEKIGEISDLVTGEAQDLLEVRLRSGRKVLIPFVDEIVPEVSVEHNAIVITPPSGLLELNQD